MTFGNSQSRNRTTTTNGATTSTNGTNGRTTTSEARPPFKLGTFCIDEYRPLKVVVIGTGFSGITAGIR